MKFLKYSFNNPQNIPITKNSNKFNKFLIQVFLHFLGDRWWFVLTNYSIQLYKDESEQERKLVIPTEKLKLTEIKSKEFKIFHSEGKYIYRVSFIILKMIFFGILIFCFFFILKILNLIFKY